jgi:hypothetical protein
LQAAVAAELLAVEQADCLPALLQSHPVLHIQSLSVQAQPQVKIMEATPRLLAQVLRLLLV